MSTFETGHRFLRPNDLGRTRRNHRQLQAQRLLMVAANALLVALLAVGSFWLYHRTQQDSRFAIRSVEISGAPHTPAATISRVAAAYRGRNLFRLDIAAVQQDFLTLPWVERIRVEKKLPDTLVIHVIERTPSALVVIEGTPRYVDAKGRIFADLSPATGNAELPLITETRTEAVARCVEFLEAIRTSDPLLYSRVSEIQSLEAGGFRLFDRALAAYVFIDDLDSFEKWRTLYRVAAVEGFSAGAIEYADLRFNDRIVVKPRAPRIKPPVIAPKVSSPIAVAPVVSSTEDTMPQPSADSIGEEANAQNR